jgi:UDP-glucose 4-epimerase
MSNEEHLQMGASIDKRCLILGGGGFLGSVVTRHLVNQGWHVRVFDKEGADTSRLQSVLSSIDLVRGDFLNAEDLDRALDEMPVVIHFVGTTIPQTSMNDIRFDIESNVLPTVRLLELMRRRGTGRLLYSSSGGTVYGVAEHQTPIMENHRTDPIAAYGISKLTIEKFIQLFSFNYDLRAVILRFANPYGEGQDTGRSQGAVGTFVQSICQGKPIQVWGDGSNVRDYIYEEDVATAVESVLQMPELAGTFNVGTGQGTSLNDLIRLVERVFGRQGNIIRTPARSFDVPYNVLDIDRVRTETGWMPRYTLEQGLQKMKLALLGSMREPEGNE